MTYTVKASNKEGVEPEADLQDDVALEADVELENCEHNPSKAEEDTGEWGSAVEPEMAPAFAADSAVIDSQEPIDNAMWMYLREIGKVPLLRAKDERALARKIEEGQHLTDVVAGITRGGVTPSATDITLALFGRIARAKYLVNALGECLGLHSGASFNDIGSHPGLCSAMSCVVDEELTRRLAAKLGQTVEQTARDLVILWLDSRLLPPEIQTPMGKGCSVSTIERLVDDPAFADDLRSREAAASRHYRTVGSDAKKSAQHLNEANLRLVVSVARKYRGRGMS
ncbi:MAG: hypothetical protein HYY32_06440, partial [Chloroflexi bacterium]|nr:hypothetical protein [Chloroflexota bacterium]